MLKIASFLPHPPIIIPSIGNPLDLKKVKKTIHSLQETARIYKSIAPETVIVVSPHAPLFPEAFTINTSKVLFGHFLQFGDFQTELVFKNDLEIIKLLKEQLSQTQIPYQLIETEELDHGTLVPLFYLSSLTTFKILSLSYSLLDRKIHYEFGKIIQKVAQESKKNIAFVASGDLSHSLTPDAPAGFTKEGKIFDEKIVEMLKKGDVEGILNMEEELVEKANECGYRSLLILLGVLDGLNWMPQILSYEGPFGVGYLVANFYPIQT